MMEEKTPRIGRPRQLYVGHKERKYISIEQRG
jgi:citrate synthase